MVLLKQKMEAVDRQNKRLRLELSKKDSAFMKCADLCAFFSKVLSNEYVTLERMNGFKVPLGETLMQADTMGNMHLNHFEWSNDPEDIEDSKFFGLDDALTPPRRKETPRTHSNRSSTEGSPQVHISESSKSTFFSKPSP